jgi:hypothetical protein
MKWSFSKKEKSQDWEKFLGDALPPETRKQRLLTECKRNDVSIFVDDVSEISSGVYAELRGVASEAELERRLMTKKAVSQSKHSNFIAIAAIVVSIGSFIVALYALNHEAPPQPNPAVKRTATSCACGSLASLGRLLPLR